MTEKEKLSDEFLDILNGGHLFVSVNGGDRIPARPICAGNTIHLDYTQNGRDYSYNTGIKMDGIFGLAGLAAMMGLYTVESQPYVDYVCSITRDDN